VAIAELLYNLAMKELRQSIEDNPFGPDSRDREKLIHIALEKKALVNQFVAPVAIRAAVEKALRDLGVADVTPTEGDDVKANLTAGDFKTIQSILGEKLKSATTASSEQAYAADLNDTWELKIYQDGKVYRAAVGYHTKSAAHYADALTWMMSTKKQGIIPNGANAETFLGKKFGIPSIKDQLVPYIKKGYITQKEIDQFVEK